MFGSAPTVLSKTKEAVVGGQEGLFMTAQRLPNEPPPNAWAGASTGGSCAVCGRAIERHEMEYEVDFSPSAEGAPQASYYFHVRCFMEWESNNLERKKA
jgi:hypothetical protein